MAKIINAAGSHLPGVVIGIAQQKARALSHAVKVRPYSKTLTYTTDINQDIYLIMIQLGITVGSDRVTIINGNEFRVVNAINEILGDESVFPTITWKGGKPPFVVKLMYNNPGVDGSAAFMDSDTAKMAVNINTNLTDGVGDIITSGSREYIITKIDEADGWWADDLQTDELGSDDIINIQKQQNSIGIQITDSSAPPRTLFAPFAPNPTYKNDGVTPTGLFAKYPQGRFGPPTWCVPAPYWDLPETIVYDKILHVTDDTITPSGLYAFDDGNCIIYLNFIAQGQFSVQQDKLSEGITTTILTYGSFTYDTIMRIISVVYYSEQDSYNSGGAWTLSENKNSISNNSGYVYFRRNTLHAITNIPGTTNALTGSHSYWLDPAHSISANGISIPFPSLDIFALFQAKDDTHYHTAELRHTVLVKRKDFDGSYVTGPISSVCKPSADLLFNGTATVSKVANHNAVADLLFGGTATVSKLANHNATADLLFGGTATVSKLANHNATADLLFGGTAAVSKLANHNAESGDFIFNGVTEVARIASHNADGYFVFEGTPEDVVKLETLTVTVVISGELAYGLALSTVASATVSPEIEGSWSWSPPLSTTSLTSGAHNVVATFTPTDTDYEPASDSGSVTVVGKALPVITWVNPAAITYGTALSATQLNATSNVPGTFVYSPSAGNIIDAANSNLLFVTFTPTDTANYSTTTAQVTIKVNKAAHPTFAISASGKVSPPNASNVTVGETVQLIFNNKVGDGSLEIISIYDPCATVTSTGLITFTTPIPDAYYPHNYVGIAVKQLEGTNYLASDYSNMFFTVAPVATLVGIWSGTFTERTSNSTISKTIVDTATFTSDGYYGYHLVFYANGTGTFSYSDGTYRQSPVGYFSCFKWVTVNGITTISSTYENFSTYYLAYSSFNSTGVTIATMTGTQSGNSIILNGGFFSAYGFWMQPTYTLTKQ